MTPRARLRALRQELVYYVIINLNWTGKRPLYHRENPVCLWTYRQRQTGFLLEKKMKEIPLTQGKFAMVDDEDFDWLSQWKWRALKSKYTYYAVREGPRPERKNIFMHRLIMNTPGDMSTDHKDRNGLNNQRENLRVCTVGQNNQNSKLRSDNTTGFRGVYPTGSRKKYAAKIRSNGKFLHLGVFDSAAEAARAYDAVARGIYGELATTNF